MDEQEQLTADALERLHPSLAGLFRTAHLLIEGGLRPGDEFLLAVAGRELGTGLGKLLDPIVDPTIWPSEDVDQSKENHRTRLGQILGLPASDPLVIEWFAAHGAFNSGCHWPPHEDSRELGRHFRTISAILVSRLGSFFASQDSLASLAAVEAPGKEDAQRLRPLLLLPVQREYFFERVISPDWLQHLDDLGCFARLPVSPPPDRWAELARWASWPEGSYLERIAVARPSEVRAIMLGPPSQSDNPLVWRRLVRVALLLPVEHASPIAKRVTLKVKAIPPFAFAMEGLDLITRLAQAHAIEAVELAEAFLSIEAQRSVRDGLESTDSTWRFEREPIFGRLPSHADDTLSTQVLPALIESFPVDTFRLLVIRVRRAIAMSAAGQPPATSKGWCRKLDDHSDADGIRALLLRSLANAAVRVAQNAAESEAREALQSLLEENHDAFLRVLWYTVAKAGERHPDVVDSCLCDDRLLSAWWGSREAALLLRTRLCMADSVVQVAVLHAFERGPSPAALRNLFEYRKLTEPSASDVEAAIATWQRERLRWFRGDIPDILRPLASHLGVFGMTPTTEEQLLAEDHFSSGSAGWVSPRSPLSETEWNSKPAQDQVAFLATWQPQNQGFLVDEDAGLQQMLGAWAQLQPAKAIELLSSFGPQLPMRRIAPLLDGLREVVGKGEAIAFTFLSRLLAAVLQQGGVEEQNGTRDLEAILREILRLVARAGNADRLAPTEFSTVCVGLATIARSQIVWNQGDVVLGRSGLAHARDHGWNSLAGELVQAAVEVGLSRYRGRPDTELTIPYVASETSDCIQNEIIPLFDAGLSAGGMPGLATRYQIGENLPQLRLLAPNWVKEHVVPRFATGISDPDAEPIWAAYLLRHPLYDDLFREWSEWYSQAAQVMPVESVGLDTDRTPFAHLCLHLTVAYLRQLLELGDPEGGLESAYRRLPPSALSHIYWQLWRGLTDSEGELPVPFLHRLESLWRWRLDILEESSERASIAKEAEGLCRFVALEKFPATTVLSLAPRTVGLLGDEGSGLHSLWGRLSRLVEADATATLGLVRTMIAAEFRTKFPHLDMDEVRTICQDLRARVDSEAWDEFVAFLDDLGRKGWMLRALVE